MILTCPNCASRYMLSAQVLAPDGCTVKCSSCGETWFQLPDADELIDDLEHEIEEIPDAVKPIPEGSSVPALSEHQDGGAGKNTSATMAGMIGALLVFLLILGMLLVLKAPLISAWPPGAAFYNLFAEVKAPGEGLVFDRVKAEITPTGRIVIEGSIINLTAEDQVLPAIEMSVRDQAGVEIKALEVEPPYDEMKAESTLPFQTSYKEQNGELAKADHVQVRFVLGTSSPAEEPIDEDEAEQGAHHEEAAPETHEVPAHEKEHQNPHH